MNNAHPHSHYKQGYIGSRSSLSYKNRSRMISSITWVPRGAANPNPPRFQACKEEVEALLREHGGGNNELERQDFEEEDEEEGQNGELDRHGLPVELHMDDYDDEDEAAGGAQKAAFIHADASEEEEGVENGEDEEDEDEEEVGIMEEEEEEEEGEEEDEGEEGEEVEEEEEESGRGKEDQQRNELAGALPASAFLRGMDDNDEEDDDSEDMEDHMIKSTDAVVLVANTEDEEHSALEVHVYEEDTGSLYIHHDISLPAFPLCVAWGHCPPVPGRESERGSFAAVGTFKPGIEIWDVDIIDPLEPVRILGGEKALQGTASSWSKAGKKGGKKKKKRRQNEDELVEGSHEGPVMTLAWNQFHRQVLASGSADSTIKLWDVTTGECSATLAHHTDKADPECVGWCPHAPSTLLCTTEDGSLVAWDVRAPSGPLWKAKVHTKTCSSFSFSALAPGLMATCGMDKTVKLWDYSGDPGVPPRQLGEKAMSVGKLFSISFYPSSPFLLATGGDKGLLALWNLHECEGVMRRFGEGGGKGEKEGMQAASMMEGMSLEGTGDGEKERGEQKDKKKDKGGKGKAPSGKARSQTGTSGKGSRKK
ncbi:hypothetical protein NGA_0225500 [Nannochloropsis gaditana CCMP526]|uniref:uncharacterized protein n=1 Tax=Nannochloropsis gaditana (strain CCMP526) TaxID=1093141 RepID=UPI00029F739E|nr:hypothetical protein NGA_0225500 [Nannochloropsis gaditana CCMP526]EKU22158.1 hypothetical protein NGA_0225500 [Nannochloropsis gaditana CCMP526]|eukprot:XP_005854204.1 hypothetical protein NGA_0225500 [Nannochloropsis gaditana CCMP526]